MDREIPLGKSRKRFKETTNTNTLRLASQAIYERPSFDSVGLGGVPARSVYQDTINSIQPEDATRRCLRERASVKFSNMVMDASKSVSLDRFDEIAEEVDEEISATGTIAQQMEAAPPALEPPRAEDMPSFGKLAEIVNRDRDCRLKGAVIRDFFAGGTDPNSLHLAATYYRTNRPYAGLIDIGEKQPKYSESGYRLKNEGLVG